MIVVLVILAILAAILVPALLGWIDKAKEKQVVLNARSAYLAAQTLVSEEYGKKSPNHTNVEMANLQGKIKSLADVSGSLSYTFKGEEKDGRKYWTVDPKSYTEGSGSNEKKVTYTDGQWTSAS